VLVDGGRAFVEKRSLQNAADAASLAAAAQMNTNGACGGNDAMPGTCRYRVRTTADQYLAYNGVTIAGGIQTCNGVNDTNCFQTPYNGDNGLVLIKLTRTVSTFIGGPVGVGSIDISARAASRATAVTAASTTLGQTYADQTVYLTNTNPVTNNGTTNYSTNTTPSTIAGTTRAGSTVVSTVIDRQRRERRGGVHTQQRL